MFEKLALGEKVIYVMDAGDYAEGGAYKTQQSAQGGASAIVHERPALVVETWGHESGTERKDWTVNLVVLTDGMNDGYANCTLWKTSVQYSAERMPGTWHF